MVVFVEELRGVLRPHTERAAEHFSRSRRRRETDHRITPVRGCPRPMQGTQRRGFAGTGGADQQIQRQPGTGDARYRDGLVGIEPNTPDLARGVPRDEPRRQCWPANALAVRE